MMAARSSDPTFAVAFGGGGARGLAHIHVVEALDELGIRPVAISGSSIGAIIGAGVAAGLSGKDIHDHTSQALGKPREVAARVWRSRPETWRELVGNGVRIGQFDVQRIVKAFLPDAIPDRFEDLKIPLQITATDFYGYEEVTFSMGELLPAIAASAAVPAIFRPILHDNRVLVDGGIVNPVPFDLLMDKADIVIGIDVVGVPYKGKTSTPGPIDLLLGASQIMMQSIISLKLREAAPHIFLRPPVSKFRVMDFMKIEQVLADTAGIKDELKTAIDAAVERHLKG